MPNIANIFKAEITRVARKEVRAEVDSLRKALAAQRSAIAALKREIADLHKGIKRVQPASCSVTCRSAVCLACRTASG